MKRFIAAALLAGATLSSGIVLAQNAAPAAPGAGAPAAPGAPGAAPARPRGGGVPGAAPLGAGPWDFKTEAASVHVSLVTKGLDHPWALAFLPNGDMLVTERPGRLRVVRKGLLDPNPVSGVPAVDPAGLGGLFDVALHPNYARNHWIYLAYAKPDPNPAAKGQSTIAVARAKYDGKNALTDVTDIFVGDAWYGAGTLPTRCCGQGPATGSHGGRIAFDKAGKLYITSGDRNYGEKVQDTSNEYGKILRVNDDGSVPKDNPFVGKAGYDPKIWTIGHRNPLGLSFDTATGTLWESEFGPRGGDEINRIEKGKNYGWINVTQGNHYNGEPAKGVKNVPGMEDPVLSFAPSINPGNVLMYRGSRFAGWKGNLIMPDMTRTVLRVTFDAKGNPVGQERMLGDLKQRFRDIRQGPDGALYILTDETDGALLKLEPGKS